MLCALPLSPSLPPSLSLWASRLFSNRKTVDMWSIGVIIYIVLAGYPPFHDEDQNRLYRKIKAGHFRFDPEYWNAISSEAKVR